jgi:twitching motility protein PilT
VEVLLNTAAIADCIRDETRTSEIRDHIAAGGDTYGMQTFDQHLARLVQQGVVDFNVARAAATNPSDFELHQRLGAAAPRPPATSGGMMDGLVPGGFGEVR